MRLVFIALIGIGYPSLTLAGWGSGGGSAIVCYFEEFKHHMPKSFVGELPKEALAPEHIESITQYDLYYAQHKERSSKEFDEVFNVFGGTSKSLFEIVALKKDEALKSYFHRILGVVKLLVPRLGEIIEDSHRSFDVITKHRGIPPVPDFTDHLKEDRPDRCTVAQMARQRTLGKVHELDIDSRLFFHEKHSIQSQVTVFFHEDVYLYGRTQRGHDSADETHALVAQLLNGRLNYDRLMRAAGNFGLEYEDSLPYVRIAKRIDDFNTRLRTVSARFDTLLAGAAEQFLHHSIFKTMPSDYPSDNPFLKSLSSVGRDLKEIAKKETFPSRMSTYFDLIHVSHRIEDRIVGPLVTIRRAELHLKHAKRRSDRREEEKKIEKANPFLPRMERYLDEYAPMEATLLATLDPMMSLYEKTLKEELETGIEFDVVEGFEKFLDDEVEEEANALWRDYVQTRIDWIAQAQAAWKKLKPYITPRSADRLRELEVEASVEKGAPQGVLDGVTERAREADEQKRTIISRLSLIMPDASDYRHQQKQEDRQNSSIQDKVRDLVR